MVEYITVSQFAELRGISKQAVYKQLNNQLKEFVIVVENKKHISVAVLTADELKQVETKAVENSTENSTEFNNQSTKNSTDFTAFFQQQIAEKDKTIASLLEQIANLQELNTQLAKLLENQQVLHASEKPALLEMANGEKKKRGFLWWKK